MPGMAEVVLGPPPGKFIHTKHGVTHYLLEGRPSAPLLILQHGLGAWVSMFDRLAARHVAQGYRVLRFDFYDRGWSQTDPARYPVVNIGEHPLRFDVGLYVEQLVEILQYLSLDKTPLVYAGSSTGGAVGIKWASTEPINLRGLVLLSTVCLPAEISFLARLADLPILGAAVVRVYGAKKYLDVATQMRRRPEEEHNRRELRLIKGLLDQNPAYLASMRSTVSNFEGFNRGDLESEYRHVCTACNVPIQLIWGTEDRSTPFAHGRRLAEIGKMLGADVNLVAFEGVPHVTYTPDAHEAEVGDLLETMLRRTIGAPSMPFGRKLCAAR